MRIKITGENEDLENFIEILTEQNKVFRLYGSENMGFSVFRQNDKVFEADLINGPSLEEISSLKLADFRFYTNETENELLVEYHKALQELFDFFIYHADAYKRTDKHLSDMYNSLASSIKNQPEEWIKALEFRTMDDKSFFIEEETDKDYVNVLRTIIASGLVRIPSLDLIEYYRTNDYKLPEIEILKNKDHIFYITYPQIDPYHNKNITLSWRNIISALNLQMSVIDSDNNVLLLL